MIEVVSRSPQETRRIGALLGPLLRPGDVVLLEGPLGAGKTVFAQGIAAGLGVDDPLTSPTFTLIHEHVGRLPLYHIDLYRLSGAPEAGAIGLEEYLGGDGAAVVEWPDRATTLLPAERLVVGLTPLTGLAGPPGSGLAEGSSGPGGTHPSGPGGAESSEGAEGPDRPESRRLTFTARGDRHRRLLADLAAALARSG
jgi:tRNA threonylcarbamoyladenosine biosynthesis protein TsaE